MQIHSYKMIIAKARNLNTFFLNIQTELSVDLWKYEQARAGNMYYMQIIACNFGVVQKNY